MAITTLDGAIAGMQWPRFVTKALTGTMVAGRPQSLWALAGSPGAGAFDTTLNGVVLNAPVNGQIPFSNPVSGNTYLARLQAQATISGTLVLCDRIWHNGNIAAVTTAQSITSPTWPARDNAGTTNGEGILVGVEVSAAPGAATPTITLAYTNSAGTGSRSATNIDTVSSAAVGNFFRIGLQAGDLGVRSIQSITFSAAVNAGSCNVVAYRPLASLEITSANVPNAIDALTAGFPRIFDSSVPFFLFIPSTTTSSNISGSVVFTQG